MTKSKSSKILLAVLLFGGVVAVGYVADVIRMPGRWETANDCLKSTADRMTNICTFAVTFRTCIASIGSTRGTCQPASELAPGAHADLVPLGASARRATFACRAPYVPRTYPKQHKPSETTWGCGAATE